ncbi:MAG: type IV secretion protein IcmD [Gammaproteobacteria bacterium]|nr:type IV secretion protein IcmD [Gammaproteobacteria bacterium]
MRIRFNLLKTVLFTWIGMLYFYAGLAFADEVGIGVVATRVTQSFQAVGKLMAATAYLAGFGLTIASIFKFKQHKDNPTQIPMGTPIALLIVGICLIFLPSFITPAGQTLFASATPGGFTGGGVTGLPQ